MMRLLQESVTAEAGRRPEAVSVVFRKEALTYGELEAATNQLSRLLRAAGCRRGDRVALLIPKSLAAVVGIIGTLKADCAYVPIDTSSPRARVARILELCESRCVLATAASATLLAEVLSQWAGSDRPRVGWLDGDRPSDPDLDVAFSRADFAACSSEPRAYESEAGDIAHILFTSGSTGTPKGVTITHANVLGFLGWATRYFGMNSTDRISGHPPLHFDLSTFDMFGTLSMGAQLHLVPPELNLLPHRLAEFIRASELTQWFSVPSILTHLAKMDAVSSDDFPTLKRLLWCGEVFPTPALIYWMTRLPHVRFVNLYGPTETTIASSYFEMPRCPDDERAPIAIGLACGGEELLVLDEGLRPVEPDQVGELYIGGVGVSPGYWNDVERTREAFLENPFGRDRGDRIYRTGDLARIGKDGLIYLIGRVDSQIKSRGYRIELGEIEASLATLSELRESAVVAIRTGDFRGTMVCCAYVVREGTVVSPRSLRAKLAETLPSYMLPERWTALAEMPRNANGKVDRARLRSKFEASVGQTGGASDGNG